MDQISDNIYMGISSCLLGHKVRFDGGHKKDRYITDILGEYFIWIPTCPELELGMGVPRESVSLRESEKGAQMLGNKTQKNWTQKMRSFSNKRLQELNKNSLCGYIFKQKSPSCGISRVSLYQANGQPSKTGKGLFSQAFAKYFPLTPIEEEGRLKDAKIRENFLTRVFAKHRLNLLYSKYFSKGEMVDFHGRHKYLLLAHSPKDYKELGQLVAHISNYPASTFKDLYAYQFMSALQKKATVKKNENVLLHILGHLKKDLLSTDKVDIIQSIQRYKKGYVPLIVPITLLSHYAKKFRKEYLEKQYYLAPHPVELMLRNHV